MRKLYIIIILMRLVSAGQEVKKFTYPNGQQKSEISYNKDNVITKYTEWDQYGNLLSVQDFSTQYVKYPKKDYSKIKWSNISEGVRAFKFNSKDTNVVVNDSSFVVLNYQCYFEDGRMLDNSFEKGCPLQTRLDYMVKGFVVGVKSMKPGETALIRIEPKMGFGAEAAGNVPANSILVYLIELISAN